MNFQVYGKTDVVKVETDSLAVWIRRPQHYHANWWIVFCSTNELQTRAWNWAIKTVCGKNNLMPFHQLIAPTPKHHSHAACPNFIQPSNCAYVVQGWEMLVGCSEYSLEMHDLDFDTLVLPEAEGGGGDAQLRRVLEVFPTILSEAEGYV